MDSGSAYAFIDKLASEEYDAEELSAFLDYLGSIDRDEAALLIDAHWAALDKYPLDKVYVGPDFMGRLVALHPLDQGVLIDQASLTDDVSLMKGLFLTGEASLMDETSLTGASRSVDGRSHVNADREVLIESGKQAGMGYMIERYWKKALVAAVFLAIGTGIYFAAYRKDEKKPAAVIAIQQSALSTDNHTILTLADGNTIILDTARDGVLAHNGNRVLALEGGLLVYRKESTTDRKDAGGIEGKGQQETARADAAPRYHTLVTARGARFGVKLEDGSQIWLNTASTLKIPVPGEGGKLSRMVMLAGEAYFDIRHDAGHPFVVKVNNSAFTDLGTRFNIMAYDDDDTIKATVFQGAVRLNKDTVERELTKGEQAQISRISSGIHVVKGIEENGVIAWKNGFFHFYNADLRTVIRQLARWYDLRVVYEEGAGQGFHLYTGEIQQRLAVQVVLENIVGKDVPYTINNKTIYIKRK